MAQTTSSIEQRVEAFRAAFRRAEEEVHRLIVGQEEVVRFVLIALFADGHVLLEGAPGLGKTMLVRVLAAVTGLEFRRVQFTPDLMPADITGTRILVEDESGGRRFEFQRGPVFTHLLLADEINRASPRTQSALLEAMQERTVTAGTETYSLPRPFLVLATQNPIEMEGTYPLPEAQLDRFLFKLLVDYPSAEELAEILNRTTAATVPTPQQVLRPEEIPAMQRLIREVPVADHIRKEIVQLILRTHPETKEAPEIVRRYVRYGASPRGAQALELAAKVHALLSDRYHVAAEDVRAVVLPSLRHRIVRNFEAIAEGIESDAILAEAIAEVSGSSNA